MQLYLIYLNNLKTIQITLICPLPTNDPPFWLIWISAFRNFNIKEIVKNLMKSISFNLFLKTLQKILSLEKGVRNFIYFWEMNMHIMLLFSFWLLFIGILGFFYLWVCCWRWFWGEIVRVRVVGSYYHYHSEGRWMDYGNERGYRKTGDGGEAIAL